MKDQQSSPVEYILYLCENNTLPSKFDIFSAKDELKYLRGGLDYLRKENELLKEKIKLNEDENIEDDRS